ncbi:ArsR family transcriptional regulator [Halopolyspora algeriensis]|uniref:ArsR family transcriptional regulator n=1 Tax=Halopolyspora algeriensis TaxID=1500506 RepID=A0A368VNU7_9ACTN|nr:metalloregulator ArsR/SmtB family transcription factor [Halopolyspora algeriensis]RCW40783.1 ArsR family transcriptional regulator [Halopolyspora algeriensis]TQM53299.1 ArsR family transcriptional regulator [Halopolyspora algeriensis]
MPVAGPDSVPETGQQTSGVSREAESPGATSETTEHHVHSPERTVSQPAPRYDTQTLSEAGELLRALAAPVRISIVLQLRAAERCVHELVDALGVTQPLISQHLRVLKSAGVVRGQRHGREVVYRLSDEHLAHIVVDAVAHAEETSEAAPHGTRTESANTLAQHSRHRQETA